MILRANALHIPLKSNSVRCVITSPPYWKLRDFRVKGQVGTQLRMKEYLAAMVEIFRDVRRVLDPRGTLWLNIGDSYATGKGRCRRAGGENLGLNPGHGRRMREAGAVILQRENPSDLKRDGLKMKDLAGVPWRLALALQEDGWWLRSEIIWYKPNGKPESAADRPPRAHEYVFLLTKSKHYYYNRKATKEPAAAETLRRLRRGEKRRGCTEERYMRSVWTIPTQGYPGPHFAVYPEELVRRCMFPGTREGDTVLDPFCGSGTTAIVAQRYRRRFVGLDLSMKFCRMARERIAPKWKP